MLFKVDYIYLSFIYSEITLHELRGIQEPGPSKGSWNDYKDKNKKKIITQYSCEISDNLIALGL